MSDLVDVIQESAEHASESKINRWVAIWVAIIATFMAFCNVKDGNLVQGMDQAQAHSIDSWSYFQAKSTKEAIIENSLEYLKAQNNPAFAELIKKDEEKIAKYEKEKADIKKEAEGYLKLYNDLNVFDDQFDMTDAFLSIAIALFGITALTQRKWLFYFAASVSIMGIILGLAAFFKYSIHSDFISSILG